MDKEAQAAKAILNELARQAEASGGNLNVVAWERGLSVQGPVDLEALARAVIGSIAGEP